MNSLGVYFGPKIISIVETKGKTIVNKVQIPQAMLSVNELEETVPAEVKIVAFFKDELRKNKVDAKEVAFGIPGQDLIIRTFDMPIMPRDELENAIRFEAKKYIPFKIEDLVADFQVQTDKPNNKNIVLFTGIKKETLDKYLSIISQLDLKANVIEYSAFGVLKLLKLTNINDKGIIAVMSLDLKEEDEVNFLVLENGFPLFGRDITMTEGPQDVLTAQEPDHGTVVEKLKTEIRISLDYYHRKFPTKKIDRLYFVSPKDYYSEIEVFVKDIGLSAQMVNLDKIIDPVIPFSLSLIKAYAASLSKTVKLNLKADLLDALQKSKQRAILAQKQQTKVPSLISDLKLDPKMIIVGIVICAATFGFGIYRIQPLKQNLNNIINQRPSVKGVDPSLSYEDLGNVNYSFKKKVEGLDKLINGQTYLTKLMEGIGHAKTDGLWVTNFNFKVGDTGAELILDGMVYLNDSDKEFSAVNTFFSGLQTDTNFTKYFKDMSIASVNHGQIYKELPVTVFRISCRSQARGR